MRYPIIIRTGVLLIAATCLSFCTKRQPVQVTGPALECVVMQVDSGYGYAILQGKDTLIVQPFIPAVGKRRPFASEEDARTIGKLVMGKMAGAELPTVTHEEIQASGIEVR